VNHLDMCNEVLIRMREDEIQDVLDKDNEPQQKLIVKFVEDAYIFVQKSHTWNSSRRVWAIDLEPGQNIYWLGIKTDQAQLYSLRYGHSEQQLIEVSQRDIAKKVYKEGRPAYYAPSQISGEDLAIQVYPAPDDSFHFKGPFGSMYNVNEFKLAEYGGGRFDFADMYDNGDLYTEALYNGNGSYDDRPPNLRLIDEGYKMAHLGQHNTAIIDLPEQPILYYALALASRERGEVGGQSSQELFALSRQYLSEAISWDVSNSRGEYLWESV
jgi:hypothetical protein